MEKNGLLKFEESVLNSSEQRAIQGGIIPKANDKPKPTNQTPIKPIKTPLSTQSNGDPEMPDPGSLLTPPLQRVP